MNDDNETEDQFAKRMAKIRAGGPKKKSYVSNLKLPETTGKSSKTAPSEQLISVKETSATSKPKSKVITSDAELDEVLDIFDRRAEQGLDNFPLEGQAVFSPYKDGKPYQPTHEEMLREVSSWFVKKDNKFYDVNNLQTSYVAQDIKQVIIQRLLTRHPTLILGDQFIKDFFRVLLDPPPTSLNPEQSIPVWSGNTVNLPGNRQQIIFRDGVVLVNLWRAPAYRKTQAIKSDAFDVFLEFVIPKAQDREVFLNWLAWSLQNEAKKPKWAVMLYSQKQGTGKTTLTDVCRELFGLANTSRTNGVNQLVARFNKEVLQHKLVIVEEIEVGKGSAQANKIKTLITEDSTTVEAKGLPSTVEEILCSFIFTTNHLPLWLETADRRFFILNFDHEGYNNGGKDYDEFRALCRNVFQQIKSPQEIKGIYDSLMSRNLTKFDAMSLDVETFATEVMVELRTLAPDVVKQNIEEVLEENFIVFVPSAKALELVKLFAYREANASTHLFLEMGWKKERCAWDGGSQKFCWVKPSDNPKNRGAVWVGAGHRVPSIQGQMPALDKWPEARKCEAGYERMWQQIWRLNGLTGEYQDD